MKKLSEQDVGKNILFAFCMTFVAVMAGSVLVRGPIMAAIFFFAWAGLCALPWIDD